MTTTNKRATLSEASLHLFSSITVGSTTEAVRNAGISAGTEHRIRQGLSHLRVEQWVALSDHLGMDLDTFYRRSLATADFINEMRGFFEETTNDRVC